MRIQAHISVDAKSYQREAQTLLKLRNERKLNKLFLLFLRQEVNKEKQLDLLCETEKGH